MRILTVSLIAFSAFAQEQDPPCAKRTDLKGSCYRVSGSLILANGTPSARIRVPSSNRTLGVEPYFTGNNETFAAPRTLRARASFDHETPGAFLVCPLSKPQPGHMQTVCVESWKAAAK